jgi:surface antigen
LAHLGLVALSAVVVLANNPAMAHAVSVRISAAHAGLGATLDPATTASVAADIAEGSHMLVAGTATRTASNKNQQVALLTADDDALAKRQVVATAGNATRDITSYSVQPGDTLSGIASKFNITTDTILWVNGMSDADMVKPGQNLTILPVSGLLYTVKAGDTADSLAGAYQANAAQILSFNNDELKGVAPGQQIIIPDGVKPQPVATPQIASNTRSNGSVLGTTTYRPSLTHFSYSGDGYSYGYCTWYVASRRNVPSSWGNANSWYYNAQASGFSVGSTPIPGAIAWTGAGYYGHVAYVESVSGGMVTVSEMNYNGNWGRVTSRTVPAYDFRYIY